MTKTRIFWAPVFQDYVFSFEHLVFRYSRVYDEWIWISYDPSMQLMAEF